VKGKNILTAGAWAALILGLSGCAGRAPSMCELPSPRRGIPQPMQGDEIYAAGIPFHIGARVVRWDEPNGYNGYLERPFFSNSRGQGSGRSWPRRTYGSRFSKGELGGARPDLEALQGVVDQFVFHYDAVGTSRGCFRVLHDERQLSVHFLLDLDGTIYQTLDLKEAAWHATISNRRSIGIEIANVGAYPPGQLERLREWYARDSRGRTWIRVPDRLQPTGFLRPGFRPRPARSEPVEGVVQGARLIQYDFTPEQYQALIRLTAALCRIFPKIRCDCPRDAQGRLIAHALTRDQWRRHQGLLGHYHIQKNKVDPGPAFQWETVIEGARRAMESGAPGQIALRRGRSDAAAHESL